MSKEDIEKEFLKNVKNHKLKIELDQGVFRCIQFKKPGTGISAFRLVTWPGHLAFSGDMGDYIFARTNDMFTFFRDRKINPSYWGEKLQSIGTNEGFKEFSREIFLKKIKDYFDGAIPEELVLDLDHLEHEYELRNAVYEYTDNCEIPDGMVFTYQYLWCCHAIVWGIKQYDKFKGESE